MQAHAGKAGRTHARPTQAGGGEGRGEEGRADPRGQSGRGPPPRIRSWPHLCSPYIPSQASQTRTPAKWPLGLCSLTIFSQAGEKIACQLGRGWPATGNRVGAPAPLTAGPGPRLPAAAPTGPSPRASHRVPALPSPLLFLAQPSAEAPGSSGQPHSLPQGVPWGDPGGPRAQAAAGLPPPPILGSRGLCPPVPPPLGPVAKSWDPHQVVREPPGFQRLVGQPHETTGHLGQRAGDVLPCCIPGRSQGCMWRGTPGPSTHRYVPAPPPWAQ